MPLWKPEEIELLKKYYPKKGMDYVAKRLKRSPEAVRQKAVTLKVQKKKLELWHEWQIKYLKKKYNENTMASIGRSIHRSEGAVAHMAQRLNLKFQVHKPWTKEHLRLLKIMYPSREFTIEQIMKALGRSKHSIQKKAPSLNLKRPLIFRDEEAEFIKKNYGKMASNQIARKLGRSVATVHNQLRLLGVKPRPHKKWSDQEIKFLIKNYKKMSLAEISGKLKRGAGSIANMAAIYGVQKTHYVKWTKAEEKYLYKNFLSYSAEEDLCAFQPDTFSYS